MRLTLKRAESYARRAARDNGLELTVVGSRWLSKGLCEPKGGGPQFRVALVEVQGPTGVRARKMVTLETDGAVQVR